jgi:hypothetical protein
MKWVIVLQPTFDEDYQVYSGPPVYTRKKLRGYLFALINSFGVSLIGGTAQYLWRNF